MKILNKSFLAISAIAGFMLILFTGCKKEDSIELPSVNTIMVSNIKETSAQSGGNITNDGGADINSRGLVWSTSPNPTIENHIGMSSEGAGIGNFVSIMTELEPDNEYFVRAWATNKEGTAYGQQINFITLDYPAPVVVTAGITKIRHETATGGGQVISGEGYDVIARGVVWSTSENPDIDNNEGMTEDGNGLGHFTSDLTGLSIETTYYVRAYASNVFKTGYGEQIEFTTEGFNVTDIDGNVYPTVIIGNQEWMAENLKTTKYSNGTPIEYPGTFNTAWANATMGAYAWFSNDIAWKDSYGALYNWYAVNNSNGLCPTGWHVPSDTDWEELVDYVVALGYPNSSVVNGAGNALKSCRQVSSPVGGDCDTSEHPRWDYDNMYYGTDEFGFSALPGGLRASNGIYYDLGWFSYLWTSSESSSSNAWDRRIGFDSGAVHRIGLLNKRTGMAVRCVRDID